MLWHKGAQSRYVNVELSHLVLLSGRGGFAPRISKAAQADGCLRLWSELVNKAAIQYRNLGLLTACFPMPEGYREKEMILELKLPAEGMKVALQIKKHPLFGDVKSVWQ